MNSKLGLRRKLKTHYGYLRGRILRLDNTRNLNSKGSRRNKFAFWRERRVGRCEAPRRRRCRTSSRSGNNADARPPPRPFGLRPAGPLALLLAPHIRPGYCSSLAPCQRAWGPAAKCEVISARALKIAQQLQQRGDDLS